MKDIFELTDKDFYEIAKIIDNNFNGSEKTFRVDKYPNIYSLSTNKCDSASIIRIYHDKGIKQIIKITRLGEDTEGYQEIQPRTIERVNQYLAINLFNEIK